MWKAIFALVLALVLAAPGLVWWFAMRPVPEMEGAGSIGRMTRPVVVGFDSRDVPYIQAESEDDMYAAQGYIVARERMFQMDILRRSAEGLISEIFGLEFLPADRLVRTIGFTRLAQAELEKLTPEARASLDSYCRGVNAYLEDHSDRLPVEFTLLSYRPRPWTAIDTLAVSKYLAYELDESWKLDELRWRVTSKAGDDFASQLFRDDWAVSVWAPELRATSAQAPPKVSLEQMGVNNVLAQGLEKLSSVKIAQMPPTPLWGSTAWVLSGRNAKSGLPLIAADKHGAFSAPNEWFLCSMSSPAVHVAGACIPGIPGIISGRNDYVAWSGSSLRADVQDLFVEHFDSELGSKYKSRTGEAQAVDLREVIPIRLGKAVEHRITSTKHGPILFRDKESAVALSWTGFDTSRPMLNSLYLLNRAKDYDEFLRAVSSWGGSPQLFVGADVRGSSGCHAAGLVPVRSEGATGTGMSEGWMGKGEWLSFLSFDDLPQMRMAPDSSDRKTGNFCIAAGQRIAQGKLIGHQWAAPYRANRLALALPRQVGQKIELADCGALQADQFAMLSRLTCDELKKAVASTQSIEVTQTKALELMSKWDGMVSPTSSAATVYESFVTALARRLIEPKIGPDLTKQYLERWPLWTTFVEYYLREKPTQWLPPEERSFEGFLVTTLAKSNTRLKLFFKNEDVTTWQWQGIHQGTFRHLVTNGADWLGSAFSSGRVPCPGDADTINCCDYPSYSRMGPFEARNGPIVRLLIDMADNEKFYANMALGQSGHYFSPYKVDQLPSWVRCEPLAVAFSRAQQEKQIKNKLYLSGQ